MRSPTSKNSRSAAESIAGGRKFVPDSTDESTNRSMSRSPWVAIYSSRFLLRNFWEAPDCKARYMYLMACLK